MLRPQPTSTLFPYTTLFRSHQLAIETTHFFDKAKEMRSIELRGRVDASTCLRADILSGSAARLSDGDRKSTRLNSCHRCISYAVFCLKKKISHMLNKLCQPQ